MTESALSGRVPSAGDFDYYAPWIDVTIFYEDWRYSEGLIKLGMIESGVEKFLDINSDFTVAI
ncbi:cyclophilin-like fold protein [Metabacillus dongyingensis]|uniref:cyclophilin-like fold protein n=1 Tax=Metabacillus dongyingensis TaxID=2874282 RepID=UPI001FB5660A|nr:cyclophilin-like fold protein [Metabacillus dongyingensis]